MLRSDLNFRPRKNMGAWTKHDGIKLNIEHSGFKYDKQKHKSKIQVEAMRKYVQEYCDGTSLHGLKYVGADGASLCERMFWILSFISAIAFSAYFISNIYEKWEYTPVIVGINPSFKSISSIPFPAITICNMNQVRKSVAMEILNNDNEVELLLLEDFCSINSTFPENMTDEKSSRWDTVKNFMLKVSQPCSQLIVNCRWQGEFYPCNELINPALTDEGVCCTFNRVAGDYMYHNPWLLGDFNLSYPENSIDWSPENGYPKNSPADVWPYRPSGSGAHLGLTIVADVNTEDYYCSSTNSVGLKVRLHSPVESPMIADYGFFMHPRKENRVAISPTVDEASQTIRNIPIVKRQCLFSHERDLVFYRTYTKSNCELECISNYTLHLCSCVPYYLPKNLNTKICGKKKEHCYKQARADMETVLESKDYCNCLPACYEISYLHDLSIGDVSDPRLRKPYVNNTELTDLVIMHFYFLNTQFRSYQKSELFGFTEFLANSGGLLGLFLGFSFLSAVELGYHLTLKIWCVYYKKRKEIDANSIVYPFAK